MYHIVDVTVDNVALRKNSLLKVEVCHGALLRKQLITRLLLSKEGVAHVHLTSPERR